MQKAYGFKPSGSLVGNGNRCIDVPIPSGTTGDVKLFGCTGGGNQAHRWDKQNSILYTDWWNWFEHYMFGLANVPAATNVRYSPYSTTDVNQTARFSNVMIKGLGNKCLDVVWGDFRPGSGVWMWDCHGGSAQRWQAFKPATGSASEVQIQLAWNPGVSQALCLDVPGGSFYEGAPLQVWSCNGGTAQRFTLTDNGEMTIGGYCVDVRGYSVASGAVAQLYRCLGQSNQKWHFTGPVTVGTECLDVGPTLDTLGTANAWHRPVFGNACTGGGGQEFDYYFRN